MSTCAYVSGQVCASHHGHVEVARLLLTHGAGGGDQQQDRAVPDHDTKGGGAKHKKTGTHSAELSSYIATQVTVSR